MENFETGLLLLAVGMSTVFIILLIVINFGKGLIILVNKYAPEEIISKKNCISCSFQYAEQHCSADHCGYCCGSQHGYSWKRENH